MNELARAQTLPLSQNPAAVYVSGLASAGSRRTMRGSLDLIAGLLSDSQLNSLTINWSAVRFQHVAAIRSTLAERYAPATANKHLSALRGALKSAWKLGQMDIEEYHRAADIEPVRGSRAQAGRALGGDELTSLFQACETDPSPAGLRDAAVLAVLYGAGLRRSAVATLLLSDYRPENGLITIQIGKGNKSRTTYITNGLKSRLDAWIEARGPGEGALFCRSRGERPAEYAAPASFMTDQAIYNIVRKRRIQAGLEGFTPHDLRRTYISDLIDAGADISAVKELAGHANVQTTVRYDRRGERAKMAAAALLDVKVVRKANHD